MYNEAKRIKHRMTCIGHKNFTVEKLAFEFLDCVKKTEKKILKLRLKGFIRKTSYGFINVFTITLRRSDRIENLNTSIKEFEQNIKMYQELINEMRGNLNGYNKKER